MRAMEREKLDQIFEAAGSVRSKVNQICLHYEAVANRIKRTGVGWRGGGLNREVKGADINAAHLMIHWLDQRLERIEEQLAQIATDRSDDSDKKLKSDVEGAE